MADATEPKLEAAKDEIPSNEPKLVESENQLAKGSAESAPPVSLFLFLLQFVSVFLVSTRS